MHPDQKARADDAQVRREQMIVLRERGISDREIGRIFDVTRARVRPLIQDGREYRVRHGS